MTLTRPAYIFALLIFVCAALAHIAQYTVTSGENPDSGAFGVIWLMVRYFTITTNGLVLVLFAFMLGRKHQIHPAWLGGLTLWMAIVAIIFHGLLSDPDTVRTGTHYLSNLLYHTVIPIAVVMWWAAFAQKHIQWRSAFIWLIYPAGYLIYALIRGQISGFYPYFFVNLPELGWSGLLQWALILLIAFALSGLAIIAAGRALTRASHPR